MARPHVPKFGNWESGDNVPYTVYFDKAREGRNTGKLINPNDPQENPELFSKFTPPKFITKPEELIIRGAARPTTHERKKSRENGEVNHFSESPARNKGGDGDGGGRGSSSGRPVRQSVGSEDSIDKPPLHPHYQGKVAAKVASSSPSWEGMGGTPERARMRSANRGRETPDRAAAAVPKFGAWENDPSSAAGYTHIFNKVREEKHSDSAKSSNKVYEPSYPPRRNYNDDEMKTCCFPWGRK